MRCNLYKDNIPIGEVGLDTVVELVRTGEMDGIQFRKTVDSLRYTRDKMQLIKLKQSLPAFTPFGTIKDGKIDQYSQLVPVFVQTDKLEDIRTDPHVVCAYRTNEGVLALVKVEGEVRDHEELCDRAFNYIHLKYQVEVDWAAKDFGRKYHLGYDPDCHYNPDATALTHADLEAVQSVKSVNSAKSALMLSPRIPDFVFENLPDHIKREVNLFSKKHERDVFLLSLWVVYSGGMDRCYGIYGGHEVHANIYALVIAPPASGKSTMGFAEQIGSERERKLVQESEDSLTEWKAGSPKTRGEQPPYKSYYIPGNSSLAGLIQSLRDNEGKGVIFETEADTLSTTLKQTWADFSDLLRKAFHHERVSTARKDARIQIQRPRLSICMTGTPGQLTNLIQSTENGFFSRILFYLYETEMVWEDQFAPVKTKIREAMSELAKRFELFVDFCEKFPFVFELTDAQKRRHFDFFSKMTDHFDPTEADAGSLRRMGLIFFRLTMILTAMRRFDDNNQEDFAFCDDRDFEVALKFCETFYEHSKIAFELVNKGMIDELLRILPQKFKTSEAILAGSKLGLKRRLVMRRLQKYLEDRQLEKVSHGSYVKL